MTAYSMLNVVVQGKIQTLKEEPYLEARKRNVLIYYKRPTIDKAIKRIIIENSDYKSSIRQK